MPSQELYDIILPQDPGFNWFLWLETTLLLLLTLALISALVWLMRQWWRPLRWRLEYRWIIARAPRMSEPELLMVCQSWRQATQVFWHTQTDYAQSDFQAFAALLDQACYGGQAVAREALLDLLEGAGQQLWDLARKDAKAGLLKKWQGLSKHGKGGHD